MPAMRVHELAKEFGMTSKELLDKLAVLKIPAKNHASTLVDAYVDKIRKQLGPEIAERQQQLEEVSANLATARESLRQLTAQHTQAEQHAAALNRDHATEQANLGKLTAAHTDAATWLRDHAAAAALAGMNR